MKKTETWQIRQGDLFIERVGEPADKGEPVAREGGAIVLAYGESSGHRHQITGKAHKLFQRGSARYLEIGGRGGALLEVTSDRGEQLTPERHAPVKLPPGTYRVTVQREWTMDREIRRVID
jgi:hypothetical protein